MKISKRLYSGAVPVFAVAITAAWIISPDRGKSQTSVQSASVNFGSHDNGTAHDPGVRPGPSATGSPLMGLTSGQLSFFNQGLEAFQETDFVHDPPPGGDAGLGPGFNSDSCTSCHAFPAAGGSSPSVNPQYALATKMGAHNKVPSFITQNGPVREVRFQYNSDGSRDGGVHDLFSIAGRTDAVGCTARQEDFSDASNISFRIPTPTFGLGLIEAIPDSALRANLAADSKAKSALEISGKFNVNGNDGTITRFGWKAQNKSLQIFAAEAYNVEQGITNPLFPQERNEAPGCMYNSTPEDSIDFTTGGHDDVALFAAFMRFLAPPTPKPLDTTTVKDGALLFVATGCAACHTPLLQTGNNSVAALNQQPVALYSDLAVHGMGPGLADDIVQGAAQGDEFRTAPLWGLGQRIFFLHDGRTNDLVEAIEAHASKGNRQFKESEANTVIHRYNNLSTTQQQNLLNFLRSL